MAEPTLKELQDDAEMSRGCFDMIKDKLVNLGISMDACPPMFYPEAIHNLYVWTAFASRDCERDHKWHNGDSAASGKCIHERVVRYCKEQSAKERVRKKGDSGK